MLKAGHEHMTVPELYATSHKAGGKNLGPELLGQNLAAIRALIGHHSWEEQVTILSLSLMATLGIPTAAITDLYPQG